MIPRIIKKIGAFALGLLLMACSDPDTAGGTASDGESFVYGYVQDSMVTAALLRPALAVVNTATQVVLSREVYTAQGLEAQWSDTVYAAADGYFTIALPDSGQYTLIALAPSGSATVYADISYSPKGQDLGRLGLYGLATLTGSMAGRPACTEAMRLSMPGRPDFATLAGDGRFTLTQVPVGRAVLLAQCDDTVQQWAVRLPGACPTVWLDSIPWNEISGSGSQSIATGKGYNAAPDMDWNWRQREALTIGTDCRFSSSGGSGKTPRDAGD